jgi:hypothetical protein
VDYFIHKMDSQAKDYRRSSEELQSCLATGCQPSHVSRYNVERMSSVAGGAWNAASTAASCGRLVKDRDSDADKREDVEHCARAVAGSISVFRGALVGLNVVYVPLWQTINSLLDFVVETFVTVADVLDCNCSDPVGGN